MTLSLVAAESWRWKCAGCRQLIALVSYDGSTVAFRRGKNISITIRRPQSVTIECPQCGAENTAITPHEESLKPEAVA